MMAKVSIRKDDYDRVIEIAERAAKRTNSKVVVAFDRLDLQETTVEPSSRKTEDATAKFS